MSRKAFIESVGGTCLNWQWSWSFVNHEERFVIFGAWDRNTSGQRTLILSEDWQTNDRGRKNPGYKQSREHVRLVEEEGYALKTFPMAYSDARQDEEGRGPAKIEGFEPVLSERVLVRIGDGWYASDRQVDIPPAEELDAGGQAVGEPAEADGGEPIGGEPIDRGGQGFRGSAAERRAIELHAMALAQAHFSRGWETVVDTSANAPYDLYCEREEEALWVEVKGTTGGGDSVILTAGEVRHAQAKYPDVALFVVAGIELERDGDDVSASGGDVRLLHPWDLSGCRLDPVQYKCTLVSE